MNRNRSSQKYITLCLGEEHTHLPERIPFYPRQNFFRMPLLLVLSLIASIAAPLCSGADKVMGATADSTRTEAPTEQPATGKLTLLREVKNRAEMVHVVTYNPDPRFEIWVPTELKAEYDAIPTETEKFAWLAERFRVQFENGDVLSGNDLGILHLYGLGVEKDWKKAQELFVEPIKKGRWVGQRYLAELLLRSPEQPKNARLAAELLIPMLKAKNRHAVWAAFEADNILRKSENPKDKTLATQLVVLCAEMIENQLKSPPANEGERWVLSFLSYRANRITQVLLNNDSEVNRRLAESLIAAWLLSEPRSVDAKIRSLGLRVVQNDFEKQWDEANALLAGGSLDENTKDWVQEWRVYAGVRLSKLGTELSWEDLFNSSVPKKYKTLHEFSGALLFLAALGILLWLLVISLLTRFRKGANIPLWLLVPWGGYLLIGSSVLVAPSWIIAPYCLIGILFLLLAVTGPHQLPYLGAPRRDNRSSGKIWLEMAIVCLLLFGATVVFDSGYFWLFQRITGAALESQFVSFMLKSDSLSRFISILLVGGIFVPVLEEIFFRGFLHDWLSRKMPLAPAILLGSLSFGLLHGLDFATPTALAGLIMVWLRTRYQSLIPCILLHALLNIVPTILINL